MGGGAELPVGGDDKVRDGREESGGHGGERVVVVVMRGASDARKRKEKDKPPARRPISGPAAATAPLAAAAAPLAAAAPVCGGGGRAYEYVCLCGTSGSSFILQHVRPYRQSHKRRHVSQGGARRSVERAEVHRVVAATFGDDARSRVFFA